MAKLKDGFYKQTAEAIGSDLYVLLAGGGSKPLSDFATSDGNVTSLGTSGDYLTWVKNGVTNNLTVPYATNTNGLTGGSKPNWGVLKSTDYTHVWQYIDNGSAIALGTKVGGPDRQFSMQIDGFFYQNEGNYMVLDTNNISSYALTSLPSHNHSYLKGWSDTRSTATEPNDYNGSFKVVGIKSAGTTLGLTKDQAGTYATLIGWRGWSDSSGGYSWEIASTNKNRLCARSGSTTSWDNGWNTIAYLTDIPTVTNYYWADQLITSSAKSDTTPTFGSVISTGLITAKSGVQIGSTSDIGWYFYNSRICAGNSVARGVNTGSLLVSNAWADDSKVPTNGIYSKGNIITPANVQALNLNLHGDWETDFGIHFNEGGDTKYGFSLLYGNSDLFKLVTRNNGTASTVLTVGRGSTQVDFKGKVTAGQFIANNASGPHFTGTSAAGNWAYLRLNNSSCLWDIATRSDSGSGGLWLSRYSGGDNGIFVSASSTPKVGINTSSPSYALHVSGDSYTTGWSRAGNGFYIETTGVHYTSQGGVGEINLTANNEFLYSTSNGTMYFNYRAASRGTTVTNYIWNAGSSSSYATHTMGLAYFRGSGKYLRIGPQNGSHAHYETDATVSHWFNKTVQVDGNIEPYGNNEHSAGSTSYRFSNIYSYLGNFAGTVTISCAYPNIVCNNNASGAIESSIRFEIAGANKGYVGYSKNYGTFLWNSTASKYVYVADNGYFYTQSYINVGAGNEKNASNPPYVWGVNGSDNFMRTYATSSLSVGDSDKLDGEHGSRYTKALGSPNYISFTVGGNANTFYPVVISSVSSKYPMQFVNISRGYSETAPDSWNTATHKGGLTLTLLWNGSRYWDGNSSGGACYCVYKNESYSTMVGGLGNSTAGKVVWLRGGGAVYHVHAMNGTSVTATVYTSTYTDSASQSFAPKTSASGVSVRWPGYAEGADYATSAGSASSASTVTVGDSNANSTYRLVWHSGNNLYGTGGIYCNPSTDYVYANSFNCGDWFRSSGNTGWYNPTNSCHVYPNATTTYGGLMLRGEKGGYTGFILGTSTNYMNVMDNGTDKGLYQEGKLWILYYNRSSGGVGIRTSSITKDFNVNGTSYISGKTWIATTSGSEALNVGGWVGTIGETGWYNSTYAGGMYMQDTTYVRTYNSKALYVSNTGDHAIYTAGGFASARSSGSVFATYYSGTWYCDTLYTHGNGNLSISAPGGSLYLSYNRGDIYFCGGSYYINRSGNLYAKAYYETSDERLKYFYQDVIVDFNKLKAIPKKYFVWKTKPNELQIGTSAQSVQNIYPELVSKNYNGMLNVDYSKLSVIALKAIDELYDMILELRAENRQLREQIRQMQK